MNYYVIRETNLNDELYHYGVPGMKWGVRKARPISPTQKVYNSAKADYKSAKKDYNKAYRKAYGYSSRHAISQFVSKKASKESDNRWYDAADKAKKLNTAKAKYKKAKLDVKKEKLDNKKTNITASSKANTKRNPNDKSYLEKTMDNGRMYATGVGINRAGRVMQSIGKTMYDANHTSSTRGRTAVINMLGYGGKAFEKIGNATMAGSLVKQGYDTAESRRRLYYS